MTVSSLPAIVTGRFASLSTTSPRLSWLTAERRTVSKGATESEMWIDELGWLDSILYDENSESLLICLRAPKEEGQGLSQGSVEGQQSRN
jgi:hypothetical protein